MLYSAEDDKKMISPISMKKMFNFFKFEGLFFDNDQLANFQFILYRNSYQKTIIQEVEMTPELEEKDPKFMKLEIFGFLDQIPIYIILF
jgi:hypothetical protein